MKPPKKKGTVSEAYFIAKCLDNDWTVADVVGDCERYDCILDKGERLERVQIKTGRMYYGAIYFPTSSSTYHVPDNCNTKHARHNYRGQIDAFGVYSPELNKCYLIPVEEVGTSQACLRVDPPKNGQSKAVRWAKDFEI